MDPKSIFEHAGSHYHELWLLFVAVAFGVFGFAFTEAYRKLATKPRIVFSIVFVGFVLTNCVSLLQTAEIQELSLKLLQRDSATQSQKVAVPRELTGETVRLAYLVSPTPRWLILFMEAVATGGVLYALWLRDGRTLDRKE